MTVPAAAQLMVGSNCLWRDARGLWQPGRVAHLNGNDAMVEAGGEHIPVRKNRIAAVHTMVEADAPRQGPGFADCDVRCDGCAQHIPNLFRTTVKLFTASTASTLLSESRARTRVFCSAVAAMAATRPS